MMKKEYNLEGIKCAGCANTVKERFSNVPGVTNVEVSLETKSSHSRRRRKRRRITSIPRRHKIQHQKIINPKKAERFRPAFFLYSLSFSAIHG